MKLLKKRTIKISLFLILVIVYIVLRPVWIPSDADIPAALAKNYLGKQMSLSDYKVRSAEFNPPGNNIRVSYDVKPREWAYMDWNAGNGTEGEEGWLVDKFAFISYENIGSFYITVGSFTGF